MTLSDGLNILVSIVAVSIAWFSLRQSEKSIKLTEQSINDANKPFVAVYLAMVDVGHFQKYIVIKNFGATPAIIKSIDINPKIKGLGVKDNLDSVINSTIAPNQKFISALYTKDGEQKFKVTISYTDVYNKNKQLLIFNLDSGFTDDLAYVKNNNTAYSKFENTMINTLHDISKQNI